MGARGGDGLNVTSGRGGGSGVVSDIANVGGGIKGVYDPLSGMQLTPFGQVLAFLFNPANFVGGPSGLAGGGLEGLFDALAGRSSSELVGLGRQLRKLRLLSHGLADIQGRGGKVASGAIDAVQRGIAQAESRLRGYGERGERRIAWANRASSLEEQSARRAAARVARGEGALGSARRGGGRVHHGGGSPPPQVH